MNDEQPRLAKKILAVAIQILATATPLLILFVNSYSNLYEKIILIENNQNRSEGIVERTIVLETRLKQFEASQEKLNRRLVDIVLQGIPCSKASQNKVE